MIFHFEFYKRDDALAMDMSQPEIMKFFWRQAHTQVPHRQKVIRLEGPKLFYASLRTQTQTKLASKIAFQVAQLIGIRSFHFTMNIWLTLAT